MPPSLERVVRRCLEGSTASRCASVACASCADFGQVLSTAPLYARCWVGLDPDDAPIVLSDTGTHEIYALDLDWH